MSHINRKKKTLTTKRKTNRASQHDLENNTSMFESFVSVRSSKQQQDVLSSSQQSSICPISRENEDDIFAFPKKSCLSDPNKTAQTEISPQENIFDEETKVEISILDSSKLKPEEQYQLNDSSLFFESDTKKKFVPNSPVCKDSCGLNEDVDDNDDTVPIPDGSNETKASVSETNLPEEKNPDSEDNNQCPVCLKTVGVAKYLSHIKSCAAKNKLSTQQLLSALQLHKKQLAERKELGLGIPVQSYRAKVSPKRSRTNNARKGPVDSSLQLALALSASLHSAQEVEVIQEAEALKEAGLSEEAEQKLSTLEKYGFASDFPIQSTSVAGGSKCRPLPSSLLLRRTQEDRERIVTEKVAIVLITEEESVNFNPFTQTEPTLKSKRLKEKWNSDCYLWRKSLCPESEERDAFYVKSLAKFVSPSKAEVGEGLRRLSQLPGRMNTPEKDDIGDLLTPSKEIASNCYKQDIANLPTPLAINRGKNIDISSGHQMNSSFSSSSSLAEDWAKLVNKDVLSDIKIRCKDSVVIPAHKLVFYARCPRILDEIEKKGNDRDLLEWESVTAESVLAFLEFVYSGKTDKLLLLEDSDISSVKTIADRLGYNQLKDKLGEMQSLSESKKADVKKNLFDVPVDHKNNIRDSIADYFNSGDLSQTDNSFSSLHGSGKNCEEMFSNTPVINSNSRNVNCGRESPDLFADSGVTNIADDSLQEREELDILVSLIGKPTQQGVGKNKWSNDEEQEEIMVVESPLGTSTRDLQDVAILRGVSMGKRKASTISFSDDEETSLSKKHCSKNNESFENSCRDDAFDLTRDSNPPSEEEIDQGNNKNSSEGSVKCASQNSKMENQHEEETLDLTQSSKSSDDEVCESSKKSSRMSLDELDSRGSMDDLTQKKSVLENSKTDYCQDSDKDMSSISNSISKSQINNDQRELSDSLDDLTQKTVDESVSKNDPKSCDRLHNESHSFNVSTPSKSPAKFVKDDFIGDISTLCTPEARHIKNNSSKASSDYKSQLSKSSRSLTNTSFKEVQGDALNDGNYDQYYNDPIWDGYDDYYHFNYEAHTSFQTPIKNLKDISSTSGKSRSKPLSSPDVCTTDTSLTKALQKKLSQETSPICSSFKSIKSISSDNSEKSPHPLSQKRLTPSSSGSIKYIASSDSKSPKHLSQYLSNSPSPRKTLGTCHSLSINDSEIEVVPDMNSPNTIDSLKSRKNLAFEFVTESSKSKNICAEDLRHLGKDAENVATSPGNTLNVRKESCLKKDSLEAMQRLLDDSFEVNNSLLDAADALASGNRGESKSISGEAVTAGPSSKSSLDTPSPGIIVSDKVTPLADYSAMKTPTLKKELSRFGLKPSLDRRKAKLLLRYIYDQTHPVVPDCEQGRGEFRQPEGRPPRSPRKANVAVVATGKPRSPSRSPKKPEIVTLNDSDSETEETCSQMSTSSSISSSASLPEESYHEPEDILTQDLTEKDVRSAIRKLITGDLQLHRKVLMYEPIQLEELMARLKTNGIKSKTNDVMDFLDEQCITFRTNSWKATNEKRRQKSPKKKKPQNAGPSGSPLKDKAPVVKKRGRPKKTNS
ncbi:uncharacterized protein LOC128986028 isoform X2 [Macrosteles quadrilineatus]|uniref:uncharacterized protein LOC128986028 isoform X2 n=1 Tax=Macrosteles quadrilineatus TaxID=74068 RepID=UPI0023E15C39|nr:uncharacterized protein LOC128986028 isoform X2 [Macrosteles quadrilineatus]